MLPLSCKAVVLKQGIMGKADFIRAYIIYIVIQIHRMENNNEECYDDGGQNLIGYINNVLMRKIKICHLEYRYGT